MLDLPGKEIAVFGSAAAAYLAAAVVGLLQVLGRHRRYERLLPPLVALATVLEAVLLILRAVAIKAVPLTGTFESLIVLTIVFALVYLFFSIAIHRVWFGSVMVWVIFALVVLAAAVAEPASAAHQVASTPWAVAHGLTMILGGAAAMLASASAALYLFARRKLKRKDLLTVLGKVPNIEKLERLNMLGLKSCFLMLTLGLTSGMCLAATSSSLGMSWWDWLTDPKIVVIGAAWLLLGAILLLWHLTSLREKTIAYATIITFALILFAVVGTSVFCASRHDFA